MKTIAMPQVLRHGNSFHDYSRIQDFCADFTKRVGREFLIKAEYIFFRRIFRFYRIVGEMVGKYSENIFIKSNSTIPLK